MKCFIKRVLLFIALFTFLSYFVNLLFIRIVFSKSLIERTRTQYIEEGHTASILVMGDSHAKHGIDPEIIGSCFNYAGLGENYLQTYFRLNKLIEDPTFSASVILLQIDLHSFLTLTNRIGNEFHWKNYIDFIKLAIDMQNPVFIEDWAIGNLFSYVTGSARNLPTLEVLIGLRNPSKLISGHAYSSIDHSLLTAEEQNHQAEMRVNRQFQRTHYIDDVSLEYFNLILNLCDANEIQVILISYPITNIYYEYVSALITQEELLNCVDSIVKNHSCIVEHLNYLSLFWGKDSLFMNSDHLNSSGAQHLSRRISNDLRRLL